MAEALLDSSGGRTNAGTDECCSSASIIATALTILTMVMLLTGYDDDDGTDDGADDGDACGDDRASRGFVLAARQIFFVCLRLGLGLRAGREILILSQMQFQGRIPIVVYYMSTLLVLVVCK